MQQKKYDQIDFDRLVEILLPSFLRKHRMTGFLKACIAPAKVLYEQYRAFSKKQEYEAGITAQAGLIEKALNDAFDKDFRRCQIVHELLPDGPTMYLDADQKEDRTKYVLYQDMDDQGNSGMMMHLDSESSELPLGIDFRVKAPLDAKSKEEAIKSMVRKYKFASKTFDVEFR